MFVPDVLEKVRVPFSGRTTRRLAAVMTMTGWCAQAQPLAVYDFSAGTVGAAADVIADAQGDATYAGQASATSAQGVVPYYTNNAPNRIATDYTCRAFYHAPKALAFEYGKDPGGSSTPPGGQVNFPDLAARLIGRAQAYTIEYFVRLDESFDYGVNGYKYKSKTSMFVGGDDYGYKVVTPSDSDAAQVTKLAIQIEDGNTRPSAARNDWFNNGRWHHLACVYKPGEGGATRGTLTFFVDYVSVGTFDFDNKTPNNTPVFRLGTGRDGKRDTEPFHGWVTCLRVTERALGWEEMMVIVPDVSQMETAGFWDFKEGTAGQTAQWLHNAVDPLLFWGKGAVTWNGKDAKGNVPVFSADRPGDYIYGNSQMDTILSHQPLSLRFAPGTSADGGGKFEINQLGSSLATLDAYTVEVFFRSEGTGDYRTPISWRSLPTYGMTVKLRNDGPSTDLTSGSLEELTNKVDGAMSTLSVVNSYQASAFTTNAWHHLAVVCDAVKGTATLFVDYHQAGVAAFKRQAWGQCPLTLGPSSFNIKAITEAYGGFLSCLRVTPRALTPKGFMVARTRDVSPTVFAWSFEEGAQKIGETVVKAAGYPDSGFDSADNTGPGVYCLHRDYLPRYASSLRKGQPVMWEEEEMWPNQTCVHFLGYEAVKGLANDAYAGTEMNQPYSIRPDRHPDEWTMEAFVKAEFFYGEATLFGKHAQEIPHKRTADNQAIYPQYCWALTMNGQGGLCVHWEEAGRTLYSQATECQSPVIKNGILADKAWHHLALSYRKETRTFRLYVDYVKVWEKTLEADLLNVPAGYYFSRIESFLGFQGWMDEIRFSNVALEPEAFVTFARTGLTLIVR